jgi:enterochelin esterase-like enzyme
MRLILLLAVAAAAFAQPRPGMTGDFEYHRAFVSKILPTPRDIVVYLPPGYAATSARYPVLYMHDGQNLFDPATGFAGQEWKLDETAQQLIESGKIRPLIIVGVYNTRQRMTEYTQPLYGRLLVEELKPFIDSHYRTLSGPQNTGLGGSSLGGLVSLAIAFRYPEVFGRLAIISPSVWWQNRAILTDLEHFPGKFTPKTWVDIGTAEGNTPQKTVQDTRDLRDALIAKGAEVRYMEAEGAQHNEKAWALRIGPALEFLFPKVDNSTLEGKVLFGYQGWFDCGSNWSHWSRGVPAPDTLVIDMYPDLKEFDPADLCAVPGMTIAGKPAYLFSSRNPRVVARHFRWMEEYGLDGALVQRFIGETARKRADGDIVLRNIMAAAAETGRAFAIEYDISGGKEQTVAQQLKDDWKYLVETVKVTAHPNYLRHNGKPVVSVWGMGLSDLDKHPPADPAKAAEMVRWFQSQGTTYIGGTPARWRALKSDADPKVGWTDVYRTMDVVQPWTVGRYRNAVQVDDWRKNELAPDLADLKSRGQMYMPVIFPGFSWHNLNRNAVENQIPRNGGEFLWRQAVHARAAGATALKIAMFDEVNESTAMFKVASRRSDAPEQGFWLTLDADGRELPSDWYLRLAREITHAFHEGRPLPAEVPRP